jgi:hypothetical protein
MTNKLARFEYSPGQSGNPTGKKPGTRNLLQRRVLTDLLQHWEAEGYNAIQTTYREEPATYLRVVASLLPREDILRVGPLAELSDEELGELESTIVELRARDVATLPEPLAQSPKKQSIKS